MNSKKQRIVVGLSGGVDSAVSAWLLKQAGHEVVGIFMKNWEDDDDDEYCSSRQDFLDAAAVADVIGIDLEHVNFSAEYKDRVFAEFLREYQAGRTPNPDVLCNAEIKFKAFVDHAVRLGAEQIATGHYARVRFNPKNQRHELLKGVDTNKDQSYFLHRLTQAQLAKTLFPLGEIEKTEVRRIANDIGLPNAHKKDSTGICFIGERPFREFLGRWLQNKPGRIIDDRGRTIGEHVGLSFYTLGQRQGLGIGGIKQKGAVRGGGDHAPWFVARKDMASNTLVAVQGHDHPWLLAHELVFDDAAWVAGTAPPNGPCSAKTRYRQSDAPCTLGACQTSGQSAAPVGEAVHFCPLSRCIDPLCASKSNKTGPLLPPGSRRSPKSDKLLGSGQNSDCFTLRFEQPQWAVTPGQSAVLYDGEVCLGGGVIASASTPAETPPQTIAR